MIIDGKNKKVISCPHGKLVCLDNELTGMINTQMNHSVKSNGNAVTIVFKLMIDNTQVMVNEIMNSIYCW